MKTSLLSRLNRAITHINADDSDTTFNEKLLEVRQYARFMNKKNNVLEEIIHITDGALSTTKHSKREKREIIEQLRSSQKKIDCLSS